MATRIKEDAFDEAAELALQHRVKAGLRNITNTKLTKAFAAEIEQGAAWAVKKSALSGSPPKMPGWIDAHRRAAPLPDALFEAIRFRDPEAAH
jgi:hypothetical protein